MKHRMAAVAAWLVACTGSLAAQQPSAAQAPIQDALILNTMFPGPQEYLVLSEGVAYRIEVEPADGRIAIRLAVRPGQPPLFLLPLSDPVQGAGGASYLMIPRESGEYRIDVSSGDPIRVRIWRDERETARWGRVREQTAGLPRGGIAARFVVMGPFPAPLPGTDSTAMAGGVGADLCLGVVPRGAWLGGDFGGCALSFAVYNRGTHGNVVVASVVPRMMLTPADRPTQVSLVFSLGLGSATTRERMEYVVFGVGLLAEWSLFGSDHFGAELEGSLTGVSTNDEVLRDRTPSVTVARVAAGLHVRY